MIYAYDLGPLGDDPWLECSLCGHRVSEYADAEDRVCEDCLDRPTIPEATCDTIAPPPAELGSSDWY